jgi:hypothetical protein
MSRRRARDESKATNHSKIASVTASERGMSEPWGSAQRFAGLTSITQALHERYPHPLRLFIIFLGLLLPTAALIPLGTLWLWQHGYLIYWALATLACTVIAYGFERMTLGASSPPVERDDAKIAPTTDTGPETDPLRADAEAAVEVLAADTSAQAIASWNDLLNTGLETVETVAIIYHPDRKDPMLRFTVPEALTLIEQVSSRLRPIFEGTLPLGSRLTVAQFAQIYRW